MLLDPLFEKYAAYRQLKALLYQWRIPHLGIRNDTFHYVMQVGRFHLYPYWRPMTRDRFERITLDYLGPHIPILGSEREYVEDEFVVLEAFDQSYRYHAYHKVHPYFYAPAFALTNDWPAEREWRWTPAVRMTPKILRNALTREVVYGGWSKNSRGRIRIPQRTGTTGLSRSGEDGAGWARYTPPGAAGLCLDREGSTDRDLHADFPVSRRRGQDANHSHQAQDALFEFDPQANLV